MTRSNTPHTLSDTEKQVIAVLMSGGASYRLAAQYVGCPPSAIKRAARRDKQFASALAKARAAHEVKLLARLQEATRKHSNWRAAIWLLERNYPNHYARRKPDTLTIEELEETLGQFVEAVLEGVVDPKDRGRVIERLEKFIENLRGESTKAIPHNG